MAITAEKKIFFIKKIFKNNENGNAHRVSDALVV
jgi:elongation factor P--beta-lysine ligase